MYKVPIWGELPPQAVSKFNGPLLRAWRIIATCRDPEAKTANAHQLVRSIHAFHIEGLIIWAQL
eukprot:9014395-Alexandrium_andersonii.AAC.1